MEFNKLVRDKIPDIIRRNGEVPIFHVANSIEYVRMLQEKLVEEARELNAGDMREELADVLEVICAIRDHFRISQEELDTIRDRKAKERGRFKKRIVLERTIN